MVLRASLYKADWQIGAGFWVGLVVLMVGPVGSARAQETIFDPENPAVQSGEDAESGQSDSSEAEANPSEVDDPRPRLAPVAEESTAPSEAQFFGSYASSLGVDTAWEGRDEDIVAWHNAYELRLEYDMPGQSRAVVEGQFLHWMVGKENRDQPDLLVNAARGRASYEARLGEAYALFRDGEVALRVGNLITSWGSTDLVRPGDVVNPSDSTRAMTAGSTMNRLLPQLTAELSYTGNDWTITGLVVPFFEPNDVTVFGRDTALVSGFYPVIGRQLPVIGLVERLIDRSRWDDVQSLVAATRVPDETPKNASGGVRATLTARNTDLGLGYFYGWDRTPWLEVDDDLRRLVDIAIDDGQVLRDFDVIGFTARRPQVASLSAKLSRRAADGQRFASTEYRRRHTVVANAARYVGPIGIRADVAFTPEQTLYTDGFEPLRRTTIFGALGLSWEGLSSGDDFVAVTVEGFWLDPFDRNSAINEAFVADADRGPPGANLLVVGDQLYGAAGAFRWRVPVVDAAVRLGAVSTLPGGDLVATASVRRPWFSWLATSVGLTVVEGPDPAESSTLTLGGLYDPNDQVTVTVDGLF